MGPKKLLIEEKTRVLTIFENGVLVIRVAANLHVSRQAIYDQNGRQQDFHLALAPAWDNYRISKVQSRSQLSS